MATRSSHNPILTVLLLLAMLAHSREGNAGEEPLQAFRRALCPLSGWSLLPTGNTVHLGERIVRFDPTFRGATVFFESSAAQVDPHGSIRRITQPLKDFDLPSEPDWPEDRKVLSWVDDSLFRNAVVAEKGWIRDGSGEWIAVVRMEVPEDGRSEPVALYVSADSGRVVHTEPLRHTQEAPFAYGAVFKENPVTTPEVSVVPIEHLDMDSNHLYGQFARAESCADIELCEMVAPAAARSEVPGAELVYAPQLVFGTEPDPFAEVNAYRNVTDIHHWMRETFGFTEDFGGHAWIWVKVGRLWDNAGYYEATAESDPFLLFGRGTEADPVNFAYDADTAHHEFGHAVLDRLWKHPWLARDLYGTDAAMGAIEEALADMVALLFSGDPTLNGYVTRSRSGINDARCPESLVSEGHFDAEPLTAFGWSVFEDIGPPFAHILYRTLHFLEPATGFQELIAAMEQSVKDLVAEGFPGVTLSHLAILRNRAEERGLLDEACRNRFVPMGLGDRRLAVGYGNRRTGGVDFPFGVQWQIEIPAGKGAFKLFFEWYYPEEDEDGNPVSPGYRVHIRRGAPVEVTWLSSAEAGEPAFEVIADRTVEGSPIEVGYPTMDLTPAEAGERFYVLLSADHPEPVIAVTGDLRFSEEPTELPTVDTEVDDAPVESASPSARSFSCSVTAAAATTEGSLVRWMSLLL